MMQTQTLSSSIKNTNPLTTEETANIPTQNLNRFGNKEKEDFSNDDFTVGLKVTDSQIGSTTSFNIDKNLSGSKSIEKFVVYEDPISNLADIYFDNFIPVELKTSVDLLKTSQEYISNALESLKKGRNKESDDYIIEFKSFLPELFCCRTISESFGAIINSIANALSNMKGYPLSETQLTALYTIVTVLLREPAMSFQKAVEYVSDFEDSDFEVTSISVDSLLRLVERMDKNQSEPINE